MTGGSPPDCCSPAGPCLLGMLSAHPRRSHRRRVAWVTQAGHLRNTRRRRPSRGLAEVGATSLARDQLKAAMPHAARSAHRSRLPHRGDCRTDRPPTDHRARCGGIPARTRRTLPGRRDRAYLGVMTARSDPQQKGVPGCASTGEPVTRPCWAIQECG
jgi:hypothetical protein